MAGTKSLFKDTAIYGMSSIIGRFLNWCLVPLYTIMFPAAEYGVVTYVYSIVALALIILTYGMETGFFRFANHEDENDPMRVYSTSLISLAGTSTLFMLVVLLFLGSISDAMQCRGHEDYVWMMAAAVALDAFTAMPFAYLRYRRRPLRFATVRLIGIAVTIGLNIWFILICPWIVRNAPSLSWIYSPSYGIGYIFLSNFIASVLTLLLLLPELAGFSWRFDRKLWLRMLRYSYPLLVLGIAGIMNQTIDKILFPLLESNKAQAMADLGIYGANYKIAIVMVMFIQAFRFAYEPFIFARDKGEDKKQQYADAMKYFVLFALVIFLGVMSYLDAIKYFISPHYFSGLKVVPIIMLAEFFFGVFFNLSVWYKLTDKTLWGMWFSLMGLAITVALNVLLVPRIGYMGCAFASLCCYGSMMIVSYFVGQCHYPINYGVGRLICYFILALALFYLGLLIKFPQGWLNMLLRTPLLLIFIYAIFRGEHITPASLLPHRKSHH